MVIVFNINGKKIVVPTQTAHGSVYISDLIHGYGQHYEYGQRYKGDIEIVIPDKYFDVIDNYIAFLRGKQEPITPVTKAHLQPGFSRIAYDWGSNSVMGTMKASNDVSHAVEGNKPYLQLCFIMCTYFIDDNYLQYLLEQLFNNWWYYNTMVYDDIGPELQWDILVHCPHDFIPDNYNENAKFMDEWLVTNHNKVVHVNNNKVYYINFESTNDVIDDDSIIKTISNYHTVNGVKQGQALVTTVYNNGHKLFASGTYFNDQKNRVWTTMYDNGQRESVGQYIKGKKHGIWDEYNKHGENTFSGTYMHGEKIIPWD